MALTDAQVAAFTRCAKTEFKKEYETVKDDSWKQIVMTVPSTKASETYNWFGATPKMREWVDERQPTGLADYEYTLKNTKYEASIEVARTAIEDDETGQAIMRIRELADEAQRFFMDKTIETLVGGAAALCYDGQYFFDNNHAEGDSGTQDNLTTSELTSATLSTARATMWRYKDDRGKPMNLVGDTIVVPPELEATALELVGSPLVDRYTSSSGTKEPTMNIHKGKYNVIVTPYITDVDSWYLLATNGTMRPLIYQERDPVRFEQRASGNDSDQAFLRDTFLYGVSSRFGLGYGDWRRAIANVPN